VWASPSHLAQSGVAIVKVDLPPFIDDFHVEMDFVLDEKVNIYVLTHSPHLSFGNPLGTVYELL
jgi:hypothetical protein